MTDTMCSEPRAGRGTPRLRRQRHERRRSAVRSAAGSATVWMLGVVVCTMSLVGLVLDGGTVLRTRSDAFSVAGAAARAGAQQLEPDLVAEGTAVIDPAAARQAALEYLAAHGATGTVVVSATTVTVTATMSAHLQMLRVVGASDVAVHATATVRATKVAP